MNLTLVECTIEYWEFVRKLRNNPKVRIGFIEKKVISTTDQMTYMKINSGYYRIALLNGIPAGYVGIINNDIRVCTHPNFQNMGIGRFMIEHAMKLWPKGTVKIIKGNFASEKLFKNCGYIQIGFDENFNFYKK